MSKPSSRGKPFETPPSEFTIDVVVDQRCQQVVGACDRMEIPGEVEVDVLHGHDLRVAAAGRAALDAEAGPEGRLAQAAHGALADAVEPVAQAHRRRRLALAGGRRVDGGDEDQLAVLLALDGLDVVGRDLGLVGPVVEESVCRHPDFGTHLGNRPHLGFAGDLDIGLHNHPSPPGILFIVQRIGEFGTNSSRARRLSLAGSRRRDRIRPRPSTLVYRKCRHP